MWTKGGSWSSTIWSQWFALHPRDAPCGSRTAFFNQPSPLQYAKQLHRAYHSISDQQTIVQTHNTRFRSLLPRLVAGLLACRISCLSILLCYKFHPSARTTIDKLLFHWEQQDSWCSRACRWLGSVCPARDWLARMVLSISSKKLWEIGTLGSC